MHCEAELDDAIGDGPLRQSPTETQMEDDFIELPPEPQLLSRMEDEPIELPPEPQEHLVGRNAARKARYKAGKRARRCAPNHISACLLHPTVYAASPCIPCRSLREAEQATLPDEVRTAQQDAWRAAKLEASAARRRGEASILRALQGEGMPLRIAIDCSFANKPDNDKEVGTGQTGSFAWRPRVPIHVRRPAQAARCLFLIPLSRAPTEARASLSAMQPRFLLTQVGVMSLACSVQIPPCLRLPRVI